MHPESRTPQSLVFGYFAARKAELIGKRRRKPRYTLQRQRRARALQESRRATFRVKRLMAAANALEAAL